MFLQCIVGRNRKYGADVILTCGFIYASGFCFSFQNDSTVLGNCSVWRIYISPQTVGNIVKIKQSSAGGWLRKIIEQHWDRAAGTYEEVKTGPHHISRGEGGRLCRQYKFVLTKIFDIPAALRKRAWSKVAQGTELLFL